METVKTLLLENGLTLEIFQTDADNPRDWDNLGKMICFHRRYDLGDKHDYNHNDYESWEEMKSAIINKENPLVILPLYLYDHSGITMNTTGFSCNWDSGQVGWIYVTKKQLDIIGTHIIDDETYPEFVARLEKYLIAEVEVYDQYLTGDVYGFSLTNSEGNEIDSCCGFFGTDWKTNGLADHVELSDSDLGKL